MSPPKGRLPRSILTLLCSTLRPSVGALTPIWTPRCDSLIDIHLSMRRRLISWQRGGSQWHLLYVDSKSEFSSVLFFRKCPPIPTPSSGSHLQNIGRWMGHLLDFCQLTHSMILSPQQTNEQGTNQTQTYNHCDSSSLDKFVEQVLTLSGLSVPSYRTKHSGTAF